MLAGEGERIKTMNSVLVYHTISSPREPLLADIDISPERFAQQLRWLARWRRVVPITETLKHNRRDIPVAITFDDGYRDNLTVALPMLEKYSVPATIFVSAGFIGDEGYVSCDELRELSSHPLITIGAHGLWHRHFKLLPDEEVREELIEARRMLDDITGQRVDLMSWPYGECDRRLEQLSAAGGYRASWSVWEGNNSPHSRWRVPLGRRDNLVRFAAKASGVYALTEAKWHRFRHRQVGSDCGTEHTAEGDLALSLEVKRQLT
jgi:peptidoglycan/xylan/chitin deacetylase (PgdA/CDA1 family)